MAVAPELLEILACPRCKGPLVLAEGGGGLGCDRCRLLYPICGDIPVMIIEEARPWEGEPPLGGRRS